MSGDSATVGSLLHLRNRLCTKIWCVARFKKYSINILNCLLLIWRCLLRVLKRFLRLGTINHLLCLWALLSCQSTPDTIHSFIMIPFYFSFVLLFCIFLFIFKFIILYRKCSQPFITYILIMCVVFRRGCCSTLYVSKLVYMQTVGEPKEVSRAVKI